MDPSSTHCVSALLESALASLTPTSFSFDCKLNLKSLPKAFFSCKKPTIDKTTGGQVSTNISTPNADVINSKDKKRWSLASLWPRRHSAAVAPRDSSPVDSAHGSIERRASPPLAMPPAYRPPSYGSGNDAPAVNPANLPECLMHSLAVVERWLMRMPGVYRVPTSSMDANALVASWYDPATGARLASAPAFDVDAPATRDLAPAYAILARVCLRRARVGVIPLAGFRAVVAAHQAGLGPSDLARVLTASAAQVGHACVLRLVMAHLHSVAQHREANCMTGENLMLVWTMSLLAAERADLSPIDLADLAKNMVVFCKAMGPVVEAFVE